MPVQDWRKPSVRLKNKMTYRVRKALERVGRLKNYSAEEAEKTAGESIPFIGDIPSVAGSHHSQNAVSFVKRRPVTETLSNLLYTPEGHAWKDGCLLRRGSARSPSILEIIKRPKPKNACIVEEGYVIESDTPYTYGDWVGDHIRALVEAPLGIKKVVLPSELAQKAYVKRDLDRLGWTLIPADRPLLITTAHILRKQLPSYYWGSTQVDAYRQQFQVRLRRPEPGSLVYLSRAEIKSEAVDRRYPSTQIAEIVRGLGGEVFDTRYASPEAFEEIASRTETIIADQGSAIFGVLQWQTKNLVEITTERWWHNANLFLAHASGVENYAVLVSDRYEPTELEARLLELLLQVGFRTRDHQ